MVGMRCAGDTGMGMETHDMCAEQLAHAVVVVLGSQPKSREECPLFCGLL